MQAAAQNSTDLQRRLLPPLLALLGLLLLVFWFALQSLNAQHIATQAQQQSELIAGKFKVLRAERLQVMDLAMKSFIRMDPELTPMIRSKNRDGLQDAYRMTYLLFGQRLAVSHFYFLNDDRETVLRMHDPDAYGDKITRETVIASQREWSPGSGLEIGRNGILSLRAVHPIGLLDNPVGFMELGIEIPDLLTDLRGSLTDDLDFEYAVAIPKNSPLGERWRASSEVRGDSALWDDFPDLVIVNRSEAFPTASLKNLGNSIGAELMGEKPLQLEAGGQRWIASPIKLDPGAGDIRLIAVTDVSPIYAAFDRIMLTAFATAAALLALLLSGFYLAMRRVNGALAVQRQRIEATSERLKHALSVANDGIWDWDLRSNSVVFDDRYYTMGGYEPGAFPGSYEEFKKRVHSDDYSSVRAAIDRHLSGDTESFGAEFRWLTFDGEYMWVRARGRIVERTEDGTPTRFIGSHKDISDVRRAEVEMLGSAEKLDKRNQVLLAINNMGQELATADCLDTIGRLAVERLRDYDDAGLVGIYLCDEQHPDELILHYYDSDQPYEELISKSGSMPLRGSFNGLALEQGQILHCENFAHDERIHPSVRELFAAQGAKAETILPLTFQGRWIGTIAMVYMKEVEYSEEKRWAHTAIAQAISAAITNLRNMQALRLGQQTAESINVLSYELNQSQSLEDLAQRALSTLISREDSEARSTFFLVNAAGDIARLTANAGLSAEDANRYRMLPLEGSWTGASLKARRVTTSSDTEFRRSISDEALRMLDEAGARSIATLPLVYQDNAIGVINLLFDTEQVFTNSRVMHYESMARAISLALHNAQNTALLAHQASHDSLTDLPNRKALHEHVSSLLNGGTPPSALSMLLLDLDRFKEVNDTLGHHLGDNLLKALAQRVAPLATVYGATLYRLGGDEFAVVAETGDAERIAEHISSALKHPFSLNDMNLELDCSIGGSVYPDHGTSSHELLRCADIAMYTAKKQAQSFVLYDLSFDDKNPARLEMLGALRTAIANDELHLVYQPRVEIATARVVSCEALLRWNHKTLGFVPPDQFIPLAEMTDIIHSLTPWVIRHSLMQIRDWRAEGIQSVVSVNISGRNLIDVDFPKRMEEMLQEFGVDANQLEFEITETALVSEPDRALMVLRTLAGLGISIAIDDFGTGYSSLDYLKRLPINALKIDRTFIKDMLDHEKDAAIVQSTIGLAHSLRLSVVAEGVEDEQTRDRLLELGCEEVQGYFYSRPLPADEFVQWSRDYWASVSNDDVPDTEAMELS